MFKNDKGYFVDFTFTEKFILRIITEYKSGVYYWEIVIFFRKLLLSVLDEFSSYAGTSYFET